MRSRLFVSLVPSVALVACGAPSAPITSAPAVDSAPASVSIAPPPRMPPTASASASSAPVASASAAPAPPPLPTMTPSDAAISAIVWTDDGKTQTSIWLDGETETARRDGVVVGAKGGLWLWTETHKTVKLTAKCDPKATGDDERASLTRLDAKGSVVVNDFGLIREFTGSQSFQHNASLVASAGPLLFVMSSTSFQPCGERGVPSQGWDAFDIESGKSVLNLVSDADVPSAAKAKGKDQCFCESLVGPSVGYFGDHPFDAIAMLANPSPYNYQLFPVPLATVPPRLRPYSSVPAGVVRWNANTKHAPVMGLSVVDKSLLSAFQKKK